MPEFTVKEVRLPELHLPEIKREDIVRSLSGVRMPEVDLGKARPTKIKVPAVMLTTSDVGKLVAAGAAVARLARPKSRRSRMPKLPFSRGRTPVTQLLRPRTRRSRRPLLLLILGASIVGLWAILRRPAVRRRIEVAAHDARERFAAMQSNEGLEVESDTGGAGAAMPSTDADGFVNATDDAGAMTPTVEAAGAAEDRVSDTDGIPAFEEAGRTS